MTGARDIRTEESQPRRAMLYRITERVPSWSVGLAGALIVLASTALTPLRLHGLEEDIYAERGKISQLIETYQRLWTNHTRADMQASTADILITRVPLHQQPSERAGRHVWAAVLSMSAATGAPNDPELIDHVNELRNRFDAGHLTAYTEMTALLNDLRQESGDALNEQVAQRSVSERRLHALERRYNLNRIWQSSLNVLGLVLVLLKDLPIWGRREPKARLSGD